MTVPEPELLHGEYKSPGGKLVVAEFHVAGGVLRDVQITGDFFLFPEDALVRLCAGIEGTHAAMSVDERTASVAAALLQTDELIGVAPDGVATAVQRALAEPR